MFDRDPVRPKALIEAEQASSTALHGLKRRERLFCVPNGS